MDTKRGQARANQRGYSAALLDLIRTFGAWEGDRQTLARKELKACLAALDAIRRYIIRLLDKGGGTLVCGEDDDALITVFNPRTYRRAARRRSNFSLGQA